MGWITMTAETSWYELFSRSARDWLRHNEKVRAAVKDHLLDLVSGPDVMTHPGDRTVQVPVRLLEHARFRLADPQSQQGPGQGKGDPGSVLRPAQPGQGDEPGSQGGNQDGEIKLLLELKIDDIIDWLWEELKLPDLKPRPTAGIEDYDIVREGWGKRGIRARLDRRRTVKEAVKRRAVQVNPVPFTDDDLRFHQLARRPRPATNAAVIFVLDVSGSMAAAERQLAKSFFFFALQGIRRQYRRVEMRFVAHTTEAWEFGEKDFFQVSGSGGTVASTGLRLGLDLVRSYYDPAQYNGYLFYASDGENSAADRSDARQCLRQLTELLNFVGYLETRPGIAHLATTEMKDLFSELEKTSAPAGAYVARHQQDIWEALRAFFVARRGEAPAPA
jgi:hypothetical protein